MRTLFLLLLFASKMCSFILYASPPYHVRDYVCCCCSCLLILSLSFFFAPLYLYSIPAVSSSPAVLISTFHSFCDFYLFIFCSWMYLSCGTITGRLIYNEKLSFQFELWESNYRERSLPNVFICCSQITPERPGPSWCGQCVITGRR